MNHRERVIAAIRHQVPDRLPVDLGAMRSTGIMAIAYQQLKQHLGQSLPLGQGSDRGVVQGTPAGQILVYDTGQQLAYVEEPVRQWMGADVLTLDRGLLGDWRPYTLPDGTPARIPKSFRTVPDGQGGEYSLGRRGRRVGHRPANSLYFDGLYHPLAHARSKSDLNLYHFSVMTDETLYKLQVEAKRLYEETDYAILGSFGGALLEGGQGLRGWDQFMLDLAGNRDFAEALLDRMLAATIRNLELYLDAVGDYIQIIQMGGDLGTQNGPQIRPSMYYEIIQPREKALWGRIHTLKPQVAVFLHSCGGIYELIPGLIDAGVDILNPVQISARGMDPARLKREFGDQLCFWGGGCDTQSVLPFASPEEVYRHTRQNIEIFKPGGGFIFCQVHNIQAGVPPQNIAAMRQAVHDSWHYSLI